MENIEEKSETIGSRLLSHKGSKMLAVASNKAGVGKTWFSITLSHALSLLKEKVLFFDGDLGLSNIETQLGLSIESDISSAVLGSQTLNQIVSFNEKTRFDIIAGRSGVSNLASIPAGRLQILGEDLTVLSSFYDRVILDMSSGINRSVRILSGMAAEIVVVCTDEPSSLTDAHAFIKIINQQYPNSKLSVVVNQADSIKDGERTYHTLLKACEIFLHQSPELLGIVRKDARIRDSIRSQTSILTRFPTSEASEDVLNIAKKLLCRT